MSIFTKRGLLLDNSLSDVNNKATAVNSILASFAGGDSEALSLTDLAPLLDISTTFSLADANQSFKRQQGFASFTDPGDGTFFDPQTYKNRIAEAEQYIRKSSYYGGNGLTGRFYRIEELPQSFQDYINDSPTSQVAEKLLNDSPPSFTVEELKAVDPVVRNDNLWINGDFTFRQKESFLEKTEGIDLALFTGYFRNISNVGDVPNSTKKFSSRLDRRTGEETFVTRNVRDEEPFAGIVFNHNLALLTGQLANANLEITNVIVRAIIQDIDTSEVLLDASFNPLNPDQSGVRRVYQFINAEDQSETGIATDRSTKVLEENKLYKISFLFVATKDIETKFNENKRVRMKFGMYGRTAPVFDTVEPMHRNYFYNEDFLNDSPPHNLLGDGEVKKNEDQALKYYGSLLNHEFTEPSYSPQIPAVDDISQQIGTPEAFANLTFSNRLDLKYEAQSGGYDSIANMTLSNFQFTEGESYIYLNIADGGSIGNLIKRGNLVYGLESSATSGGKHNEIYVKGFSQRSRILYLSEPAIRNTDISTPPELTIIDHLGHIGLGTLSGASGTGNLQFTPHAFHAQRDLKVGDFVYIEDDNMPGVTLGTPNYIRVKYTSPLTLETIATNGDKTEITTMTADTSTVLHYYAANALDNQVLDKFCTFDDTPPFTAPLVKVTVATEGAATDTTIIVNAEAVTYAGAKVNLADESSPSDPISDGLVGRNVAFDGGINAVIPVNTTIESINVNSPPDGTMFIELSNALGATLPKGSIITIGDSNDTVNKKFICFPPSDPSAPFKAVFGAISTVPELGRDKLDLTTGEATTNPTLQFNGLSLLDDNSPSPTMAEPHNGLSLHTKRLRIFGFKEDGTTECEYFIPLYPV